MVLIYNKQMHPLVEPIAIQSCKHSAVRSPESPQSLVPISAPRKTKGTSLRSLVSRVGGCKYVSHATPTPSPKKHQLHKQVGGSQLRATELVLGAILGAN